MDQPAATARTNAQSPMIYLLWAVLFANGVLRLLSKDDIPFGVLQISAPVAGILMLLAKRNHLARRAIWIALIGTTVAGGIVEFAGGHAIKGAVIFATALLVAVLAWRGHFARRAGTPASALPPVV